MRCATRSPLSTPGSARASVSSCSDSRVARSRPDLRSDERPEPLDVGRGALGELRLQVDCSERRAQLVRRVGDEGALRRKGLAEALQQAV